MLDIYIDKNNMKKSKEEEKRKARPVKDHDD